MAITGSPTGHPCFGSRGFTNYHLHPTNSSNLELPTKWEATATATGIISPPKAGGIFQGYGLIIIPRSHPQRIHLVKPRNLTNPLEKEQFFKNQFGTLRVNPKDNWLCQSTVSLFHPEEKKKICIQLSYINGAYPPKYQPKVVNDILTPVNPTLSQLYWGITRNLHPRIQQ